MFSQQKDAQESLIKSEMKLYNSMVLKCFKECVNNFEADQIKPEESSCGENCSKRFLVSLDSVSNSFNKLINS